MVFTACGTSVSKPLGVRGSMDVQTYVEMIDTWVEADLIQNCDSGLLGLCSFSESLDPIHCDWSCALPLSSSIIAGET